VGRTASEVIGREAEIARLTDLVAEGASSFTLVGPPGIGKTALARHIAEALDLPLALARLSGVETSIEAIAAIAVALRFGSETPTSDDAIGAALRALSPCVLVLDDPSPKLATLEPWIDRFLAGGVAAISGAWEARMDPSLTLRTAGITGTPLGLDRDGALRLRDAGGVIHRIHAGDVDLCYDE
jgi:hypothetical protein